MVTEENPVTETQLQLPFIIVSFSWPVGRFPLSTKYRGLCSLAVGGGGGCLQGARYPHLMASCKAVSS